MRKCGHVQRMVSETDTRFDSLEQRVRFLWVFVGALFIANAIAFVALVRMAS